MFSRKKNNGSGDRTPVKNGLPSIVSSDMTVLGNVVSEGSVDIDGNIEGNVKCQQATIRKNGVIKGDVIADSVHVYGRICGLVKARNVQLFKDCRVEGVIMHESITIEDGAFVDGRFKRVEKLTLDETKEETAPAKTPLKAFDFSTPAEEEKLPALTLLPDLDEAEEKAEEKKAAEVKKPEEQKESKVEDTKSDSDQPEQKPEALPVVKSAKKVGEIRVLENLRLISDAG